MFDAKTSLSDNIRLAHVKHLIFYELHSSSLDRISPIGGGVGGAMGGYILTLEQAKFLVFQTRKFSNMLKNRCKNYMFWKSLRNVVDFLKYLNILSKLSRKFWVQFRELCKYGFGGVSVVSPPKLAKILKNSRKIKGNLQSFESFSWITRVLFI